MRGRPQSKTWNSKHLRYQRGKTTNATENLNLAPEVHGHALNEARTGTCNFCWDFAEFTDFSIRTVEQSSRLCSAEDSLAGKVDAQHGVERPVWRRQPIGLLCRTRIFARHVQGERAVGFLLIGFQRG